MASLALSTVGSAIAGPIGGMVGGFIGGMLDNMLFPQKVAPPPAITASTYGLAIPLYYGPFNRAGLNMIWTSGWYKQSGKAAKLASLKGLPPSFQADLAMACGAGPVDPDWCLKIIANGTVLFDASKAVTPPTPDANGVVTYRKSHKTHKDFDTLVVYPGNFTQEPDPTIEARKGVGQVPAYRGTFYFVMNGLLGTPFGNSVPIMNPLIRAHREISVGQIVTDIAARCGLDTRRISTSSLTTRIRGFAIDSQSDGVSALQPLALCYDFDVAEVGGQVRFVPRGRPPIATIENRQLAGHEYGGARPQFEWPREPETQMPRIAALTFSDIDRDGNDNTQSTKRGTGSQQNQLSTRVRVTLNSDEAHKIAERMLWEAHYGRQTFSAQTDDRLGYIEAAQTYAVEVPHGYETIRVTRRARGANGVIEFDAKRDAPSIYASAAPGASAEGQANELALGGPVNPPIFIEPPDGSFPNVTGRILMIALSGGDGTTASDAWGGCNVYVATDDVTGDYQAVGVQIGPSLMGKLSAALTAYGGSNPDTATTGTHPLKVTTLESGGEPASQSPTDAADALTPYYVGGEYITAENVSALGGDVYSLTRLYRGLYATSPAAHAAGEPFARIDSAVFRWNLPSAYLGRTLYFRFVSAGETLAGATTYPYAVHA